MNAVQRQDESVQNAGFVIKNVPPTQSAAKKAPAMREKSQFTPVTHKLGVNTGVQLKEMFSALPKRLRKTMTVDNGGEFWLHQNLPVKTFFCDPHSPWQRGSIENANGVLRRYLPRKSRINQFNERDIQDIMWTPVLTWRDFGICDSLSELDCMGSA